MSHPKPTAVLIEPKAHRRLSLVNALRDDLDLSPMSAFDTALRHIRMTRPDVVLIGLGWRTNPGLRLARQIKTDAGNNARVLLIDWPGRRPDPSPADGITPPKPSTEQVRSAVRALLA